MTRGKTAMFFTITAIMLLTVVFISLIFQSRYTFSERNRVVSVKGSSLNTFVAGLEEDVSRGMFIAGYGAILAVEDLITGSSSFVADSKSSILEALMNGTINGTPTSVMSQRTLPDWLSRIASEAAKMGIILNLSFDGVRVSQSEPWSINFTAPNMEFNVTDFSGTAAFYKKSAVTAQVSLIGFEDPIYTVFTNGQIVRTINTTPYEGSYASGADTTNLKDHINRLLYSNSTGPDFLMRLEGDLDGNSPFGIESIVRLPDLQAQDLQVFERSSVDYVYFGNTTPAIYAVNQTFEDWFRLDEDHLYKYQVYDMRK